MGITGATGAGISQNLTEKAMEETPFEEKESIIKPDQMSYLNSIDTNESKVDSSIDDSTSEETMASEQVCN